MADVGVEAAVDKTGVENTSLRPSYNVPRLLLRPLVYGMLGGMGLLGFYLGVITLAQSWLHALQQLAEDKWFVSAIVAGFSTQVGLFTHLRRLHTNVTSGGMAASTGTSTAAMLACCAHHLTEVFAVVGLSGAAIFLNLYKTPLLWLGIVMNAAGIVYLLWNIRRAQGMAFHSSPQGNQQEEHCHQP